VSSANAAAVPFAAQAGAAGYTARQSSAASLLAARSRWNCVHSLPCSPVANHPALLSSPPNPAARSSCAATPSDTGCVRRASQARFCTKDLGGLRREVRDGRPLAVASYSPMPVRNVILKLHIYAGLLTFAQLMIYGVAGLTATFESGLERPKIPYTVRYVPFIP